MWVASRRVTSDLLLPSRATGLSCGVTSGRIQSADQEDSAMKKYRVTPTDEERQHLQARIAAGKAAARTLAHARILLEADQADGGPARPGPTTASPRRWRSASPPSSGSASASS